MISLFRSHYQARVFHQVGSVRGGTYRSDFGKEARVEAFRLTSAQMKYCIDDALPVLANATNTWLELDEPLEKLEI